MAFTKTPDYSTMQTKRVPVYGNMVSSALLSASTGLHYTNCQPRAIQMANTDPLHIIERRPSLVGITVTGNTSGLLRGIFIDHTDNVTYVAQSNQWYRDNVVIATLDNTTGYVSQCKYLIGTTGYIMLLEHKSGSASKMWLYNLGTAAVTSYSTGIETSGDIVFLDGYIFMLSSAYSAIGTPTQRIYNTAVSSPSSITPGSDFIDAEQFPDRLVTIAKHKNYLVAFGESSTEFFYDNAVQLGSPLSRQASYAQKIGIQKRGSFYNDPTPLVEWGDNIFFFGGPANGARGIYIVDNFQIKKISDDYVDRSVSTGVSSVYLSMVNCYGVPCLLVSYQENSPTLSYKTLCFNLETKIWSEWNFPSYSTFYVYGSLQPRDGNTMLFTLSQDTFAGTVFMRPFTASTSEIAGETFTSTHVSDVIDFGSELEKHIVSLDIIGRFPSSTVTLSMSDKADYTNFFDIDTLNYATINTEGPLRYYNPGSARRMVFKTTITGNLQFQYRGMDVTYNLGNV